MKFDEYIKKLERAEKISKDCMPPLWDIEENQNYVFISYSQADFKFVYSDLAYMYHRGIRFLCDANVKAGEDRDAFAIEKIRDPHCSGVVFYLSESFFESPSATKEIMAASGLDENWQKSAASKTYFSVNLAEDSISKIITRIFREKRKPQEYKWYSLMIKSFKDDVIYLNYNAVDHKASLIENIINSFDGIDVAASVSSNGGYDGELRDGKFVYNENNSREYYQGDWRDGEICGHGVMKYRNGAVYDGEWRSGLQHGKGKLTYPVADSEMEHYDGELRNGLKHGKGKLTYPEDCEIEYYEGEWVNDEKCGHGEMKWRNGAVYVGEWCGDVRNGKGELIYQTDVAWKRYSGEWVDDVICGHGVMEWSDGDVYVGEWLGGWKHGKGKYTYVEDYEIEYYEGEWVNDEKCGHGEMKWSNGDVYDGEWRNGARNGKGKLTYAQDYALEYYDGEWADDKMCGQGVLKYSDGSEWEGEWRDNEPYNGKGTLKFQNGDVYCGGSFEGVFNGFGELRGADGGSYKGYWKDGLSQGYGKVTYADDANVEYYVGDWVDDEICGWGEMKFRNGNIYRGQWFDANSGRGIITYSENDPVKKKYNGEWKDDLESGIGVLYYRNGTYYEGEFFCGKRHGQGTLYDIRRQDKPLSGIWENDYPIKTNFNFEEWQAEALAAAAEKPDIVYDGDCKAGRYDGFGKLTTPYGAYEGEWNLGKPCDDGVITLADGVGTLCRDGIPLDPDFADRMPEQLKMLLGISEE